MKDRELLPEEAWEALAPHWEYVVAEFARAGFREPFRASVRILPEIHDSCRHFAATLVDGKEVGFAPDLARLQVCTIRGVMAHEAGHVVDLSRPGIFWFRNEELLEVKELPQKGLRKHLRAWREREDDEIERVADALGSLVMGEKIGYVGAGRCLVECLGKGRPRPKNLR